MEADLPGEMRGARAGSEKLVDQLFAQGAPVRGGDADHLVVVPKLIHAGGVGRRHDEGGEHEPLRGTDCHAETGSMRRRPDDNLRGYLAGAVSVSVLRNATSSSTSASLSAGSL